MTARSWVGGWLFLALGAGAGCGDPAATAPLGGTGGSIAATGGATATTGGVAATTGGVAATTGGVIASTGGATTGGIANTGGSVTTGGTSTGTGGAGTTGGGPTAFDLNCGEKALVLEAHGPPENRINYIIVGDGYTTADLETVYPEHLSAMLDGVERQDGNNPGRFAETMEPYLTYRNFINICALKVPSNTSGIPEGSPNGNGGGCPDLSDTAFDGCGNDSSRLGYTSNQKVYAAVEDYLDPSVEMDWVAVVLNGSEWWNSGGIPMVWSGGHDNSSLAAQHEGGHGFFALGDEYGSCGGSRINTTNDATTTGGKWEHYLGTTQDIDLVTAGEQGTGEQGTFQCDGSNYRPSDDSVMNDLWASDYYNSISLENAIHEIYDIVDPIDSSTPTSTTAPGVLEVKVIDPAVIKIDWSVDGAVVAANGGETFDVAARGLAPGSHQITARAYDDTPWVPPDTPHGREDLEQSVSWTISVP